MEEFKIWEGEKKFLGSVRVRIGEGRDEMR
jgi:hypothetical protein